jgi:TPP-dependent 2-oxoacid decarboxylase
MAGSCAIAVLPGRAGLTRLTAAGAQGRALTAHDGGATSNPAAGYHDIPAWDWIMLPATVAPDSAAVVLRAGDPQELAWAINAASYHASAGRPVLIEAILGLVGTPPLLNDLARVTAVRAA